MNHLIFLLTFSSWVAELGAKHNLEKLLIISIFNGNVESVKLSLKNGANIESEEWSGIFDLVYDLLFWKRNIKIRKEMLMLHFEFGQDLNIRSRQGDNLLIFSICFIIR